MSDNEGNQLINRSANNYNVVGLAVNHLTIN